MCSCCLPFVINTLPTFSTAHTFCASRDGPRKSGFLTAVPAKTEIFLRVYAGKADLGKGCWNPKRKFGLAMYFSGIIKLQFGKKFLTLFFIFAFLRIIVA